MAKSKVVKVRVVDSPSDAHPGMSKEAKKREEDYQAEDDLRTLTKAEEIRGDGKRMARARRKLGDQVTSLTRTVRSLGSGRGRSR